MFDLFNFDLKGFKNLTGLVKSKWRLSTSCLPFRLAFHHPSEALPALLLLYQQ